MINQTYRLTAPKQIRTDYIDEVLEEKEILVKPEYLSICAADQRYYTGSRGEEVMNKKLPMALIHEAVGKVVYDPSGEFKKGAKVVMIPNTPFEKDKVIKENYLRSSKFKSSGIDGFMQEFVKIKADRLIEYQKTPSRIAVLAELLSVGMNALEHFEHSSNPNKMRLGVWGCGGVGYIMALILRREFPKAKLYVFGTTKEKLSYFSFADETYLINEIPHNLKIDHAFECVGGHGSEKAINQIIDIINPMGTIALMGVSETNVPINTRMILEKGLTLIGNSRSGREDFEAAVKFFECSKENRNYLERIISEEIVINSVADIHKAFEHDINNNFKTIMKWEI